MTCLQLLQGERRLTARYLSEQLGVSIRTVYRDVEALCEAGVPLHMERGPLGGIVLADGYRRALAQFTDEELLSLFAGGRSPLADLGVGSHREALRKLAGALPNQQRATATATRERVLLDHQRWGGGQQPTQVLAALRAATDGQTAIRLDYRDRAGALTSRVVDPLGLVSKAGVWYLVAREETKGYRTFRAQRIAGVERLGRRFTRPAGFDLEAYWTASVATIERRPDEGYVALVRVPTDARHLAGAYWGATTVAQNGERTTLRIVYPSREIAVAELVPFVHQIELVSPPDLIAAIVAYAETIVRAFGQPPAHAADLHPHLSD